MKRTVLKRGTKPLKRSRVNPRSEKQKQIDIEWSALVGYLAEHRAHGRDELSQRYSGFVGEFGLGGHHIIPRRFNIHNAGNCFILDSTSHNHARWGPGIPIPAEQALIEVALLNKKYSIDPRMTGADVLRMKE